MTCIATKDNCKRYVKDWGTGRPLILLHGWPLSAESRDDQVMAIADAGMRAVVLAARFNPGTAMTMTP